MWQLYVDIFSLSTRAFSVYSIFTFRLLSLGILWTHRHTHNIRFSSIQVCTSISTACLPLAGSSTLYVYLNLNVWVLTSKINSRLFCNKTCQNVSREIKGFPYFFLSRCVKWILKSAKTISLTAMVLFYSVRCSTDKCIQYSVHPLQTFIIK